MLIIITESVKPCMCVMEESWRRGRLITGIFSAIDSTLVCAKHNRSLMMQNIKQ